MAFVRATVVVLALVLVVLGPMSCAQPLPDVDDGSTTRADDLPSDPTGTSGANTADTVTGSAASIDTGSQPGCGNGIVEAGETCDDGEESATCDDDCTEVVCGDGNVNTAAGEGCESVDLAGATCEGLGFDGGMLSCGDGCFYDSSGCAYLPAAPVLQLSFSQVKQFDFSWAAADRSDYYQLEESVAPGEPYVQLGADIVSESLSVTMPLHFRHEASYMLWACNVAGCTASAVVSVVGSLAEAVGYFKASNTEAGDSFGSPVALSGDGNTIAVGAPLEDSGATGVGGAQADESTPNAGAVYVFERDEFGLWSQQSYVKASNAGAGDQFGWSVSLSDDGDVLAVGADAEDGAATGMNGNQNDDGATDAGAVYVFMRDAMGQWYQQAYLKASNTGSGDRFGYSVALSGDGSTLAVGADHEDGNGIGGNQLDDSASYAGAAYVFVLDAEDQWSQQAYLKASNAGSGDWFGSSITLSDDGDTLAVGALFEDSDAIGVNGEGEESDSALTSGAAYVFVRDAVEQWSQQAYVKASNTGPDDRFGICVALSGDGNTLAVGSHWEDSSSNGVGGRIDESAVDAGAAYVFVRDALGTWSQQAYVKASNSNSNDVFGGVVALNGDGSVLAVAARQEDSGAIGIGGDQADDSATDAGAVYVFTRSAPDQWLQRAYVKASNAGSGDVFSFVGLSSDGATLAIGAFNEDGGTIGLGGNQADDSTMNSGAVYLY